MEIVKFLAGNLIGLFLFFQGDRGIWYQVCLLKSIHYEGKFVAENIYRDQENPFLCRYKIISLFGAIIFMNIAAFFGELMPPLYATVIAMAWLCAFAFACLVLSLRAFDAYIVRIAQE